MTTVLQERTARTIDDYEQLADLEFALIVWRQNLKRDLGTTRNKEASPIDLKLYRHCHSKLADKGMHRKPQCHDVVDCSALKRPIWKRVGTVF